MWTVLCVDCTFCKYIYIYIYIYIHNTHTYIYIYISCGTSTQFQGMTSHYEASWSHFFRNNTFGWLLWMSDQAKHASGRIRTRNPSRGAAANPRLRPRSRWETCLHKVKVEQPQYRPWGFQEGEARRFQDSRQGCQPYAPAALTPGNTPGTRFC
jgi:hypothetical protein